jgi:putative transposase
MYKAYKYKIKPTQEQEVLLAKHFGSVRFIFNKFLGERQNDYKENKLSSSYNRDSAKLTQLKKQEEFSWLKEINSQTLQRTLKHLDDAYRSFFSKKNNFPNFKSKHDSNQSFCVPQFVRLEGDNLFIPKFKDPIKVILHRKFTGRLVNCTISKTPTGEHFVSILVETVHEQKAKTGMVVALDLGIKDFAITSDGYKYKNNRYTKKYAKKLRKAQKHLSKKEKGSVRYNKQKLKVARLHKKIANSRRDNLHKVSSDLISKYDLIIIEDLNVAGMVKNHKLSKHIADVSWSSFVTLLQYKAEWNDKEVVKIGRWFPSSKTCHCCGYVKQNLKLSDREWVCPSCGENLDRDLNASKNILTEGLKYISAGTVDYRHGDQIRPASAGTICEVSKMKENSSPDAHVL